MLPPVSRTNGRKEGRMDGRGRTQRTQESKNDVKAGRSWLASHPPEAATVNGGLLAWLPIFLLSRAKLLWFVDFLETGYVFLLL